MSDVQSWGFLTLGTPRLVPETSKVKVSPALNRRRLAMPSTETCKGSRVSSLNQTVCTRCPVQE